MSRAWAIPEIRNAIFAELDVSSLKASVRVCHAWHSTGIDFIWRSATAEALHSVQASRRPLYQGAIRHLDLASAPNLRRATRGWTFPRVDWLCVHPITASDAAATAALLARCGANLAVFQIATPPTSSNCSSGCGAGEHDVRRYSVDAGVLQLLAERAGLRSLLAQGATIPGNALAHVRAAVAAPFAGMGGCNLCVAAADVPALMAVLAAAPPAGRLRSLGLLIDVVGATPASRLAAVAAIAAHAPGLRALRIYYNPMREPVARCILPSPHQAFPNLVALGFNVIAPGAGAGAGGDTVVDDVIADDFRELRRLHALEALTVQGALFFMDDAGWRALLGGMPRLQRLTIGRYCTIPRDALVTAGEACRELRAVEFYSCVDFAVALDREAEARAAGALRRPPGWVLFPELRSVRVRLMTEKKAEKMKLLRQLGQRVSRHAPMLNELGEAS